VSKINDTRGRIDRQDHAFHRRDVTIPRAEISRERYKIAGIRH
jgi:hypothetical protein